LFDAKFCFVKIGPRISGERKTKKTAKQNSRVRSIEHRDTIR